MRRLQLAITGLLWVPGVALGVIDEKCQGTQKPDDYNEQVQRDFLSNYYALSATHSALHAPIPHEPGHGSLGIDLKIIPPLGCARRFVQEHTKTEDTNRSPILPVITASFAFPAIANRVVPYASFSHLPPIGIDGVRSLVFSGELGVGVRVVEGLQLGARFHASMLRVVGDVATADNADDPDYDDIYMGSTFGFDGLVGYQFGTVAPYAAVGFTDVSSYFWVGDTGNVVNNLHPYLGLTYSMGVQALIVKRLKLAGEYYGAPGGSRNLTNTESQGFAAYGHLHTFRMRLAVEI